MEWPTFTFQGKMLAPGGERIFNAPGFQGEPALAFERGEVKLYVFQDDATTQGGIGVSTRPWDGTYTTGWASRIVGGLPDLEYPPPKVGRLFHFDTPDSFWNWRTRRWLKPMTEDPGDRPAETDGRIHTIGIAESSIADVIGQTQWTYHERVIYPTEPWEQGFRVDPLGGPDEWRGGNSECSYVEVPGLSGPRLFFRGLTGFDWPATGPFTWAVSYADMDPTGLVVVTKRTSPFWNPDDAGTPAAGYGGWRGAWHPSFCSDPRNGGCWMAYIVNQTQVHLAFSPSWFTDAPDDIVLHPGNPVVTAASVGISGGQIGAPYLAIDEVFGNFILVNDGGNPERYNSGNDLFVSTAPRAA